MWSDQSGLFRARRARWCRRGPLVRRLPAGLSRSGTAHRRRATAARGTPRRHSGHCDGRLSIRMRPVACGPLVMALAGPRPITPRRHIDERPIHCQACEKAAVSIWHRWPGWCRHARHGSRVHRRTGCRSGRSQFTGRLNPRGGRPLRRSPGKAQPLHPADAAKTRRRHARSRSGHAEDARLDLLLELRRQLPDLPSCRRVSSRLRRSVQGIRVHQLDAGGRQHPDVRPEDEDP